MRRGAYLATGLLAVLVAAGCSSGSGGGSGGGPATNEQVAGGAAGLAPRPAGSAASGSALGTTDRALGTTGRALGTTDRAAQLAGSGRAAALPLLEDGFKIRTAELTVAVRGARNVSLQADAADRIAIRAGGEVDADDRTNGRYASATLQLRVPPEALTTTLSALSRLGAEKSRHLTTTDVTQRVADVNSRVASAQQSIARLRTLYAHATKIADIIQIESELNIREADLESLQAQQRALASQTELATITLSLVTAPRHPLAQKPAQHRGGFLGGLERGWHGFAAAAGWLAGAVGTLLPFLLLLLLVALGARVLWPRLPRRRGGGPASAPSD